MAAPVAIRVIDLSFIAFCRSFFFRWASIIQNPAILLSDAGNDIDFDEKISREVYHKSLLRFDP